VTLREGWGGEKKRRKVGASQSEEEFDDFWPSRMVKGANASYRDSKEPDRKKTSLQLRKGE